MKYHTPLLILTLLILSCQQIEEKAQIIANKSIDLNLLAQEWISTEQISDGIKQDIRNIYYINLKPDSTFNSFYKPDNSKKGFWRLNNDTTFTLFMKATDTFKILELTDSSLVVKVLYNSPETVFKFKKN